MVTKATSNRTEFDYLITMLNAEFARLRELVKQKNANKMTNDINNNITNMNVQQNVVNVDQKTNNGNIDQASKFGVSKFVSVALACVFGVAAVSIFAFANVLTFGFASLGLALASAFVGGYFFFKERRDNEVKVKNRRSNYNDKNPPEDITKQDKKSINEIGPKAIAKAEKINSELITVGEQTQLSEQGYGI